MTSTVRRATAFAVVGTLALVVPLVGDETPALATVAATAPFVLVAALALTVGSERSVFTRLLEPADRSTDKLYGLAGFSLATAVLALLSVQFEMPVWVFVGSVFVVAFGNVAAAVVRSRGEEPALVTGAFVVGGSLAAVVGQIVAVVLSGTGLASASIAQFAFLATSGALFGALLHAVVFDREDPLVVLTIAQVLWFFSVIEPAPERVGLALVVAGLLGYLSYELETASLPGMLTGILLVVLTVVFGNDLGWPAMLVAFFGLGGISTKFRYEEKRQRGIAEPNEGARGSGNVLANSLVAPIAVVGAAASRGNPNVDVAVFLFAYAGSVAAALGDTFSSEIGGLYDDPRLITTLEPVEPGTDGGITWQGKVAGLVGATCIATIGVVFGSIGVVGALVVVLAGFSGMVVDSFLGATLEGQYVSNQGVNLLATLSAAIFGVGLASGAGLL